MAEEKKNAVIEETEVTDDNEKETTESKAEQKTDEKDQKAVSVKEDAEEDDEEEDDEDIDTDELFKRRVSVDMSPENSRFFRSKGGLVSLELQGPEGTETFERVTIHRSFPITAPSEFLSVREANYKKKGRGAEVGMIRRLSDFDQATQDLINEELDLRYFTPEITKIISIKDKFGYSYWEIETTAGKVSMVLNNPYGNVRVLEDGRVYISDMDGNSFIIPKPEALDRASYRRIETYI